jgi:tRNA pseudouridine55 synthase
LPLGPGSELEGLLLADKGAGVTSFQVVAHLRRVLRVAKVGHGGTLDPMATGVLPILLGAATKLTPYLQAQDKEYVTTFHLGISTDTLDATGRVTAERPVPPLDPPAVAAVLGRFVGEIEQIPPMYSALHVGGRRLHELARAGVEVERAPRRVRIDTIELLRWEPPRIVIRVVCGKGTYVRSLAADVGEVVGCGAHVEALQRTRLGPFTIAEAVPWAIVRDGNPDVLGGRVLPSDRAVPHLSAVRLEDTAATRLRRGQRLAPGQFAAPGPLDQTEPCRLYGGDVFLGIGELDPGGLRPLRLLHADRHEPDRVSG